MIPRLLVKNEFQPKSMRQSLFGHIILSRPQTAAEKDNVTSFHSKFNGVSYIVVIVPYGFVIAYLVAEIRKLSREVWAICISNGTDEDLRSDGDDF